MSHVAEKFECGITGLSPSELRAVARWMKARRPAKGARKGPNPEAVRLIRFAAELLIDRAFTIERVTS